MSYLWSKRSILVILSFRKKTLHLVHWLFLKKIFILVIWMPLCELLRKLSCGDQGSTPFPAILKGNPCDISGFNQRFFLYSSALGRTWVHSTPEWSIRKKNMLSATKAKAPAKPYKSRSVHLFWGGSSSNFNRVNSTAPPGKKKRWDSSCNLVLA